MSAPAPFPRRRHGGSNSRAASGSPARGGRSAGTGSAPGSQISSISRSNSPGASGGTAAGASAVSTGTAAPQ